MKIGVITLHNVNNYGSALQTYATQYILEKMGHNVEIINYYRDGSSIEKRVEASLQFSKIYNRNEILRLIGRKILMSSFKKQDKTFNRFRSQRLNLTREYENLDQLKENPPIFDLYCTGSDQVWNSEWNSKIDNAFFLDFVPKKAKRVSLAASFGKSEIDKEEESVVKPLLERYKKLTVREDSAKLIIEKMGLNATTILDPTLLLTSDEWNDIKGNTKVNGKYIFVYQLNSHFPEFDLFVKRISKKYKLPVIRLSTISHQKIKYGKLDCCSDVENFVEYIRNAEFVITDSFHCTAFSINLNKNFVSIYPPKFPTRLENILNKTGLKSRQVIDFDYLDIFNEKIDYDKVNRIIELEREKSLSVIKEMLGD